MRFIALVIFLTALAVLGSAFFGVYTVPGLENLPTVETLGKKKLEAETIHTAEPLKPKGVVIPVNKKGKMSERNNYLNQQRSKVAPGG